MLRNYIKTAFRSLMRHKVYSLVNITGLAVGLAACLLLGLWVTDELSFDKYHEKAGRIYRVIQEYRGENGAGASAFTPAVLAPTWKEEFPGIEKTVRIKISGTQILVGTRRLAQEVCWADPEILEIFSFPLAAGDPARALREPRPILVSEDAGDKYFDGENPVGKVITIRQHGDFTITGVFKNIPANSHFRFDFLGCFTDVFPARNRNWGISNYYTYFLAGEKFSSHDYAARLPGIVKKYRGEEVWKRYGINYPIQRLTDIHLHSHLRGEIGRNRSWGTLLLFCALGLFLMLLACLNYINLSTARYVHRAREVGVRKVVGAGRGQLVRQFLAEAYVVTLLALPAALLLAEFTLPLFNRLTEKTLTLSYLGNGALPVGLLMLILPVGLLSGLLPALFLSAFPPVEVLRGIAKKGARMAGLRRGLVVFQFTVSILFIICTMIISRQITFLTEKDLGFDTANIINIPIHDIRAQENYETLKQRWLTGAHIRGVTASCFSPGNNNWHANYWHDGMKENNYPQIQTLNVDPDFIRTMGLSITGGRDFSRGGGDGFGNTYILNRSAQKMMGLEPAVGRGFSLGGNKAGEVVGVVRDFFLNSLHREGEPLVLFMWPEGYDYFSVKIEPGTEEEALAFLEAAYREIYPAHPFSYSFMKDDVVSQYGVEIRLRDVFMAAAAVAVGIACMGLLGLAFFSAEGRTKEIGVRKAMGAGVGMLVFMLCKEFARWVLVANLVAWPIAGYVMHRWLQGFPYRVPLTPWPFLAAGVLSLVVACLTVGYRAVKAAAANPVKALRYE